mgnify:CR=1 FL=1
MSQVDQLLELGWSAFDEEDYGKALTLSNLILESHPALAEAHNLRGNVRIGTKTVQDIIAATVGRW